MFTKAIAGSLIVISMGFIRASISTAEALRPFWSISLWDLRRLSPVSLRRRFARRRRMLGVEVSGTHKNMRTNTGPASQRISHRDQRHPFAVTAKPERRGPRAGPQ